MKRAREVGRSRRAGLRALSRACERTSPDACDVSICYVSRDSPGDFKILRDSNGITDHYPPSGLLEKWAFPVPTPDGVRSASFHEF
eukprot:667528-Amorphochlora_amoeboformis.AAC.1